MFLHLSGIGIANSWWNFTWQLGTYLSIEIINEFMCYSNIQSDMSKVMQTTKCLIHVAFMFSNRDFWCIAAHEFGQFVKYRCNVHL